MAILFFDTETTGLPPRGANFAKADSDNFNAWRKCRIVQIAWEIRSSMDHAILFTREAIIKPVGFLVPPEATAIHGITHEFAVENGRDLSDVLKELFEDIKRYGVDLVVAHNVSFDDNVLIAEMYLNQWSSESIQTWDKLHKVCTMKLGASLSPTKKWPKLADLYLTTLGKEPPKNTHTASVDTRMCAEIYLALNPQ
jgi:DNA polymerase III epsilon subunit-like protein